MAKVTTYNPKKVTVALGSHIASGFAEDSFINVEYAGDGTSYVTGCDGEIARSIDPSNAYTVKVTVLQNSATNTFLQTMFDKDRSDGTGAFSVNINDIMGNEKFVGSVGWVTKPAAWGRGKTQSTREWEIVVADGEFK